MAITSIEEAQHALEACRGEGGSAELAKQLVDFCVENGLDVTTVQLGTSRRELQQVLWKFAPPMNRFADYRLEEKAR